MAEQGPAERRRSWERPHLVYLGVAFGLSWTLWAAAWLLSQNVGAGDRPFNEDLVWTAFFEGDTTPTVLRSSLLSLLGVYGPMIAGIVATRIDPAVTLPELWERVGRVRSGARWYGLAIGILLLTAGPAALIVALTTEMVPDAPGGGQAIAFLAIFFVFQLLTSGTEEIGWRGYLNEKLRPGRDFWDTGWAVGVPWAAWHIPVVVMIFADQGMLPLQIVGSLAGFGIGIVAMSILHAWFYERTRSVFLNIFIHAMFNTLPLTVALLYQGSPAAVLANLALWAVVILLKRQHDRRATRVPAPT